MNGEPPGQGGQEQDERRELARKVAEKLSKMPTVAVAQPRNETGFTFKGGSVEQTVISTREALVEAVEREIDEHYGGLDLLFTRNDIATSTRDWGELLHSYMETAYELVDLDGKAVRDAVATVKDRYRVQMLSNLAGNLRHSLEPSEVEPYSVDDLRKRLEKRGAYLEPEDDPVLEGIFDGTIGQDVDYGAGWVEETGQITSFPAGRDDLVRLIDECSGNLYSTQIGTVVGGTAVKGKNVKKVAGLTDPTARIDRQNPPPGAFNVQFQIGEESHACVIFDQSDPREVVLDKLLESFDGGMQLRSPRVGT